MLSNVVADGATALQSLLRGQPQFHATLGRPELEQLRQRITAAYHLSPLNEPETRAYIEHRRWAEWKGDPHFDEACFPSIYRHSKGVPRRVNTLCSRLLLHGSLEQLQTLTQIPSIRPPMSCVRRSRASRRARVASPLVQRSPPPITSFADQSSHQRRGIAAHRRMRRLRPSPQSVSLAAEGDRDRTGLTPSAVDIPTPAKLGTEQNTSSPAAGPNATQFVRLPQPTPPLVLPTLNSRRATSEVASPTASPPSAQSPSTKDLSPTEIAALVARGDSFINVGDIASARLFYERAANAGYGPAALRLGTTFDPSFLTRAGLRGLPGDTGQAAFW